MKMKENQNIIGNIEQELQELQILEHDLEEKETYYSQGGMWKTIACC